LTLKVSPLTAQKLVPETQTMKRLLVVMLMTVAAAGCGLFRRETQQCSTGMVYEGAPCEDGGAYLQSPMMPHPQ
jgi:hypothetical protein